MIEIPTIKKETFADGQSRAYQEWRRSKLEALENRPHQPLAIDTPLSPRLLQDIQARCETYGFCLYQHHADADVEAATDFMLGLAAALGLTRLDHHLLAETRGIAVLTPSDETRRGDYIPYTDKPINWHTDGYYNLPEEQIRAFQLHCVVPAEQGGENCLLDTDLVYIQLRDLDQRYISALSAPQVMTIPANIENGEVIRPARSGPVFHFDQHSGRMAMRYTARTRSIEWQQNAAVAEAVAALEELLRNSPYIVRHTLAPGQGVLTNNCLHTRTAFSSSGPQRVMLRARYFDRVGAPVQ